MNVYIQKDYITWCKQYCHARTMKQQWMFCLAITMHLTWFSVNIFKEHHQMSSKPEIKQVLMLFIQISYWTLDDLPSLNIKIPEKPLSIRIWDKETSQINVELKQKVTYVLKNHNTEFYRKEEEFQWAQRDFITWMPEATYLQKMELTGSMLGMFTILLHLSHRNIIYTALKGLEKIPQVHRRDAVAYLQTTPEQYIFTLLPLKSITEKQESTAKSIAQITLMAIVSLF